MKNNRSVMFMITAAGTAAAYTVCTMAFSAVSFGAVQLRIAEALTVLPFFSGASVVGLFVGCALSNLLFSFMPLDFVVGSLATLTAALMTRALRRYKWLAPLPPVVINALFIGALLTYYTAGGFPLRIFLANAGLIAVGQGIVCYGIGLPLLLAVERILGNRRIL